VETALRLVECCDDADRQLADHARGLDSLIGYYVSSLCEVDQHVAPAETCGPARRLSAPIAALFTLGKILIEFYPPCAPRARAHARYRWGSVPFFEPGKPYRPLVPPASHPTKWRTTTTIPAHAPRLNATADQRMIMECQSISFMAPP
jgi:hypothetical protein